MTLEALFSKIETLEFEVNLAIASGSTLFNMILAEHALIQEFRRMLRESSENKYKTLKRIQYLLTEEAEPRFVHPNDIFIAAYLWALNKVDTTFAFYASRLVLDTPQLWWARIIAKEIIERFSARMSQPQVVDVSTSEDTIDVRFTPASNVPYVQGNLTEIVFGTIFWTEISILYEEEDRYSETQEYTLKSNQSYKGVDVKVVAS
ncbi:MAG: hypothetical protein L0154_03355 [Chloroflexi bacterium]|nr:hypothetical protein [Chloroflexota bacterium]